MEWIEGLPKIELHCHLDGAVHPQRIRDFLAAEGTPLPQNFDARISVGEDCPSLTEYLRCFELPLRWLQTTQGLQTAVCDLLRDCKTQNIRYIEIRFAPTLHLDGGLSYEQVFQALKEGRDRGEGETGVRCAFLVCAMRHHSMEQNLAMLEAAAKWHPDLVCGCDLAGDENAFPTASHQKFFYRAAELGIPYTIHSGETGNAANIETALALNAKRLGHGIAMKDLPALRAQVKAQGVGVELCPTSNFQTKASTGWEDYPLKSYLAEGLVVCLNTDNPTVSRTNLNREYARAMIEGGCTKGEILRLLDNACTMSFAPETWKQSYREELAQFAAQTET